MALFPGLPLTSAYLEALPEGLASYPDALVRGSFVRAIVNVRPPGFEPESREGGPEGIGGTNAGQGSSS